MREKIESKLGGEQHGFRKGRGTTDLVFAVRMIIEKSWEFNRSAYFAFIYLKKGICFHT